MYYTNKNSLKEEGIEKAVPYVGQILTTYIGINLSKNATLIPNYCIQIVFLLYWNRLPHGLERYKSRRNGIVPSKWKKKKQLYINYLDSLDWPR
jgi:hypothetical protein